MKGERTINIEYLVLQTLPEKGSFAVVSASKLNRSWEALQEALDELRARKNITSRSGGGAHVVRASSTRGRDELVTSLAEAMGLARGIPPPLLFIQA